MSEDRTIPVHDVNSKLYTSASVALDETGQKAIAETPDGTVITFVASSSAKDRDGESIDPNGWSLKTENVPVLVNHQYAVEKVVGRVVRAWSDGQRYLNEVLFADRVEENPLAKFVVAMVRAGFLGPVSVGFLPDEWEESDGRKFTREQAGGFFVASPGRRYIRQEQLELSVVPVGSNRDAQALMRAFAGDADQPALAIKSYDVNAGGFIQSITLTDGKTLKVYADTTTTGGAEPQDADPLEAWFEQSRPAGDGVDPAHENEHGVKQPEGAWSAFFGAAERADEEGERPA